MIDVVNRRVLVVGLGATGASTARALVGLGARVKVTEAGSGDELAERAKALGSLGVEVETGGHDTTDLDVDLAILSPGVPPSSSITRSLIDSGVRVISEIELAWQLSRCDILAVTGTNGKTTTTSLLAGMLDAAGIASVAAGNIGFPLIDAVARVDVGGAIAAEVSSFQLATIEEFRPQVAVLLNVAEDHTDWHGSFEGYAAAKARITENQGPDDHFVCNREDPVAWRIGATSRAQVVPFSADSAAEGGVGIAEGAIVHRGRPIFKLADLMLAGRAGVEDAVAASAAALSFGVGPAAVAAALARFEPLPHRLRTVATVNGVDYVDDSKATNPHATLSAVVGRTDVVLILGGRSKGIDLSVLKGVVPAATSAVVIGEASDEIAGLLEGSIPVVRSDEMDDAVVQASALARPGGSVLLSPGCASLDMYANYEERADAFIAAVFRLAADADLRRDDGQS